MKLDGMNSVDTNEMKKNPPIQKIKLGPRTLAYPMPAFLVGAIVDGKPNFMMAAWGGIACGRPPMISIAIQHLRFTLRGIQVGGAFSINIPDEDLLVESDYCGIATGKKTDKVADCGFDIFYGDSNSAPMIKQAPVNLECIVLKMIDLGSHVLVIGEITESHISDFCLTNGRPDVEKVKPLIYSDNAYFSIGRNLARAFRIGKQLKSNENSNKHI